MDQWAAKLETPALYFSIKWNLKSSAFENLAALIKNG